MFIFSQITHSIPRSFLKLRKGNSFLGPKVIADQICFLGLECLCVNVFKCQSKIPRSS